MNNRFYNQKLKSSIGEPLPERVQEMNERVQLLSTKGSTVGHKEEPSNNLYKEKVGKTILEKTRRELTEKLGWK